jgi:hypothetical protein
MIFISNNSKELNDLKEIAAIRQLFIFKFNKIENKK